MRQMIWAVGLATAMLLQSPVFAVTAKQKMETCKFGADHPKLTGTPRKKFLSNCMANRDSPPGKPVTKAKPR